MYSRTVSQAPQRCWCCGSRGAPCWAPALGYVDCGVIFGRFLVVVPWFPTEYTDSRGSALLALLAGVRPVVFTRTHPTRIWRPVGHVMKGLLSHIAAANRRTFAGPVTSFVAC